MKKQTTYTVFYNTPLCFVPKEKFILSRTKLHSDLPFSQTKSSLHSYSTFLKSTEVEDFNKNNIQKSKFTNIYLSYSYFYIIKKFE